MPFDPTPRVNGALVDLGPADHLRAAGIAVWPPEAVEEHKRDYIKRHHKLTLVAQWLKARPYMDFVLELTTFFVVGVLDFMFLEFGWWFVVGMVVAVLAALVVNRVLAKALRYRWRESPAFFQGTHAFERDDYLRFGAIPEPVQRIMDNASVFLGSLPTFRVLYCGADPILQVEVRRQWLTLAVWDELPNGEFQVLTPPTVNAH